MQNLCRIKMQFRTVLDVKVVDVEKRRNPSKHYVSSPRLRYGPVRYEVSVLFSGMSAGAAWHLNAPFSPQLRGGCRPGSDTAPHLLINTKQGQTGSSCQIKLPPWCDRWTHVPEPGHGCSSLSPSSLKPAAGSGLVH